MDSTAAAPTKALGPFASVHAFMKENAQIKARMCKSYQAQAQAQQNSKSTDVQDDFKTTEPASQKGIKRCVKKVGEFLFSGPEAYPLIANREGDLKAAKDGVLNCLTYLACGPQPYPTIL